MELLVLENLVSTECSWWVQHTILSILGKVTEWIFLLAFGLRKAVQTPLVVSGGCVKVLSKS